MQPLCDTVWGHSGDSPPFPMVTSIRPTHPGEAEGTPGAGGCSRHLSAPEELLCSEQEKAERGSTAALGVVKGVGGGGGGGGEQRGRGAFLQEARKPSASHLLQLLTWSKGGTEMANDLFVRPHLSPTTEKLKSSGKAFRPNFRSGGWTRPSLKPGMETLRAVGVAARDW